MKKNSSIFNFAPLTRISTKDSGLYLFNDFFFKRQRIKSCTSPLLNKKISENLLFSEIHSIFISAAEGTRTPTTLVTRS